VPMSPRVSAHRNSLRQKSAFQTTIGVMSGTTGDIADITRAIRPTTYHAALFTRRLMSTFADYAGQTSSYCFSKKSARKSAPHTTDRLDPC